MTTAALEMRDVHRSLNGEVVLDGLTLSVSEGECRAVVGLNGAGKTTALRVALGMVRPDAGTVCVLGQRMPTPRRHLWRHVGHLVEMPFGYPELTARQNVHAAAALHGADPGDVDDAVRHLADVLEAAPWLDRPTRRLSLGSRQKVGLMCALAHRPRLVVLDEPTNGLDPRAVVGLRHIVGELTAGGTAVLVTGHHFDELARIADSVDVLHRGRVADRLVPDGPDLERRFFATILRCDEAVRG